MLTVPLAPVPAQNLSIVLDAQACNISVYAQTTGIFFDLTANGKVVKTAVIMRDGARLLQDAQYLGFVGDFVCVDTQGELDPEYTGLGARWALVYLEAADLVTYASL